MLGRIVCSICIVRLISLLSVSGRVHRGGSVVLLLGVGLLFRVWCRWVVTITRLGSLWVRAPVPRLLVPVLVY